MSSAELKWKHSAVELSPELKINSDSTAIELRFDPKWALRALQMCPTWDVCNGSSSKWWREQGRCAARGKKSWDLVWVELCWIVFWVEFTFELSWVQLRVELISRAQLNGAGSRVELSWALSYVELWFALSWIQSWVDSSWAVLNSWLSCAQLWVELSSIVSWDDGMSSAHLNRVQWCSVELNCESSWVQLWVELTGWVQLSLVGSWV